MLLRAATDFIQSVGGEFLMVGRFCISYSLWIGMEAHESILTFIDTGPLCGQGQADRTVIRSHHIRMDFGSDDPLSQVG